MMTNDGDADEDADVGDDDEDDGDNVDDNNAFLMRRISLWLYMCEVQSTTHETLQQYSLI